MRVYHPPRMARPVQRLDRWDVAAIIVVIATCALYTREIGNDFLWGHDGGNGASYWGAAGTSLRFGVIGQVKDYTALTAPTRADFYTHHPLLLHVHLVLARALFGAKEWAGRLVPFAYSAAILPLLYGVARKHYGRPFALAALVLYALTPLHLIFATMIDHEQGGIFWSLVACHAAVRVQQSARRRHLVLLVVAGTLALQFAWASYFVLAVTGVLALVAWWRAPAGSVGGERARQLALVLSVVGLVNLGAFFGIVVLTKGSMSDMRGAFSHRTGEVEGYSDALVQRVLDLYGALLVALSAAGLARLARRAHEGRWRPRDVMPSSFLFGQIGLSLAFRNAGRIHSYWTYYAGVACALLGAEALLAAGRALDKRVGRPGLVAVLATALALQTSFAIAQQDWGLATGHAAYARAFDDQFEEVQLAKWLRARYGRDVTYHLSPSFNARTEVFYYLDAPHVAAEVGPPSSCGTRACVLVLDLRRVSDDATLAQLARQATKHATFLFGGHLLVVDWTAAGEAPHAYRLEVSPSTTLYRWLVSERHGRAQWVPREDASESLRAMLGDLGASGYVAESSKAGTALTEACPRGVALAGFVRREKQGSVVALRGLCGHGAQRSTTRWIGASDAGGEDVETACPSGEVVVGLVLPDTRDLRKTELACSPGPREGSTGASAGSGYVLSCPSRTVATSLHARQDADLAGIGIGCKAP